MPADARQRSRNAPRGISFGGGVAPVRPGRTCMLGQTSAFYVMSNVSVTRVMSNVSVTRHP